MLDSGYLHVYGKFLDGYIYIYIYTYWRWIRIIRRTIIVKLFNDSRVSIILNHYYSLFHRINFRISCICVERIRRSKFFSAITRKIRTFVCISLEFHETVTILSWRNSTNRREFDGSRNFDKRLRKKKMLAEGKSELCGKIWRTQTRTTLVYIFPSLGRARGILQRLCYLYRVSFHSLKRNIYHITRRNSRSIVFTFWSPNFYSELFYSINSILQQSLEQLQLFEITFKSPSFEEREAGRRFSFLGLFQQPRHV